MLPTSFMITSPSHGASHRFCRQWTFQSKAVAEKVVWFSLPKAVTVTYEADQSSTNEKYSIKDFIVKFVDHNKNTQDSSLYSLWNLRNYRYTNNYLGIGEIFKTRKHHSLVMYFAGGIRKCVQSFG